MKSILSSMLTVALILGSTLADAAYTQISSTTSTIGSFSRKTTVVQEGSNSVDRFEMTRVWNPSVTTKEAILMLPGGNTNFESYEVSGTGFYTDTLAGHLAQAGFEVWGYSPRSKGIPAGTCDVPFSCPYLLNWGLGTIALDADYIRSEVVSTTGVVPAIGGFSLGAITSIVAANMNPTGYSGILLWEGMLYSNDSNVTVANGISCTQANSLPPGSITTALPIT